MDQAFGDFLAHREAAARAYATGDAGPILGLTAEEGTVTFLDPGGGFVEGAGPVRADFEAGAATFGPGSTTRFEVRDSGAVGDLGWWTGFQVAEAEIKGQDGRVPMRLRITEVFRRQDGAWRLVHRHASPAKEAGAGD